MGKFEEKLQLTKVILAKLEKGPLCRTDLLKYVIESCGSPAKFDTTFNWLKATGRIRKIGSHHRDAYEVTWKGRQFLVGLIVEDQQ